jgi:hypothetical protein
MTNWIIIFSVNLPENQKRFFTGVHCREPIDNTIASKTKTIATLILQYFFFIEISSETNKLIAMPVNTAIFFMMRKLSRVDMSSVPQNANPFSKLLSRITFAQVVLYKSEKVYKP